MDLSEVLISEVQKRPALWNLKGKAYHNRLIVDRDWKKVAEITRLTVGASKVRWKNLRDHFRKELLKQHRSNTEGGEQRMSKWIYFESLLFLREVLKPRRTKGKLPVVVAEGVLEVNSADAEVAASSPTSAENEDSGDCDFGHAGDLSASVADEKEQIAMAAQPQTPTFNLAELPTIRKHKCETKDSGVIVPETTSPAFETQFAKMESGKLSPVQSLEDDDLNFFKSLLPYMKSLPPIRKLMIRSQFQNLLVQEMINCQNNQSTTQPPSNSDTQLCKESISSPAPEQFSPDQTSNMKLNT